MKKSILILPLIAALFAVSTVQADSPTQVEGATTVDAATAKTLFDRGVLFVDVRGSDHYSAGHILGAVDLNLVTAFDEAALTKVASKDQEVVIYCDGPTCFRSSTACEMAVSWGFKKVYYFRDGYPGWKAAGYPVKANPL
jgi:rhodanese-related sulfurtransferase